MIELLFICSLSIYGLHAVVDKSLMFSGRKSLSQMRSMVDDNRVLEGSVINWCNRERKKLEQSSGITTSNNDFNKWKESEIIKAEKGRQRRRFILYPLILCRPCMASFWGSIFYWMWGWILGGATITAWIPSLFVIAAIVKLMVMIEKR